MLTYTLVSKGIVLPGMFSSSIGGKSILLGVEPFNVEGTSISSRAGTLIQDPKNFLGESSVSHRKFDGHVTYLPSATFSSSEGMLTYNPPKGGAPVLLGNYRVSRGSHSIWTFRINPDSTKPSNYARLGAYFKGYVVAVFQLTTSGYITWKWYNEDFSAFTLITGAPYTIHRDEFTRSGGGSFDSVVTGDVLRPTSSEPWRGTSAIGQRRYTFEDSTNVPSWLRHSLPTSGPSRYSRPENPDATNLWGRLTTKAVESLNALNINSVAYVQEAANIKSLLPPIKSLLDIENPKNWPNLYLWIRYGLSLSYKDTKKIIEQLPNLLSARKKFRDKHERLRSSESYTTEFNGKKWTCDYHLRVICNTHPQSVRKLGSMIDKLYSIDIMPTLGNFWDLIPYTFVVDWFIPVGNALENLDLYNRLQTFQILCVTKSEKWSTSYPAPAVHPAYISTGTIEETHYHRAVSSTLPIPGILDPAPESGVPFRRYVDGTSLILQRIIK